MFGTLPPLPAARFEFSGEVNPEFLRVSEQLRAGAFYSDVLDMKTTQLILFGMLLVEHNPIGAQAHAAAARKAGASWEELHTVMRARRRDRRAVGRPTRAARCSRRCATRSRGQSHDRFQDAPRWPRPFR